MEVVQSLWRDGAGWQPLEPSTTLDRADLLLVFGDLRRLEDRAVIDALTALHPQALIAGCSSAGEILGIGVLQDTVTATAIRLERASVRGAMETLRDESDSRALGERLARQLGGQDLRHILLLSDGLLVNGSELVRGVTAALPPGVVVTGGLSGDGERFERTRVLWNGALHERSVIGIAFYGNALEVGFSAMGGWSPFGPIRQVTRSDGNVVFEFDGKPALDLYRLYLGQYADGLPATGLHFPLSVVAPDGGAPLVRTLLAIDENAGSLTFAGDVPVGSATRLMCANLPHLVSGAHAAARHASPNAAGREPQLALLISCVGRKMVLRDQVDEEVDAVREVLGDATPLAGFYSYGEISPVHDGQRCQLNNQTMCVTTFYEKVA